MDRRTPGSDQAQRGQVRAEQGLISIAAAGIALPLPRTGKRTDALVELLARAITEGRLGPGARLPSSRALAEAAGVSRNVVLGVYSVLAERGLVGGRHGSGSYVRGEQRAGRARPVPEAAPWLTTPRPSTTDVVAGLDLRLRARPAAMLPAAAWRRAWQAAAKRRLPSGYGDPAGDRRLRAALTDFLATSRDLPAATTDVVVTGGAAEALGLLLRAVVRPGDRVAVEEPGYPAFNRMVRDRDATVVPIPVDSDGISVSALEAVNPRLVLVTPACQFPTTATLTPDRRQHLLSWARDRGALVVEDDYAGEFTDHRPLATLDEHGVVAYVGTLSRLLAPSLRIGYLVAARPLAAEVARLRGETDSYLSLPIQFALADLLTTGELTRHLRRARRLVAEQRAVLPNASGLHVLLRMPEATADTLLGQGILVDRLSAFYDGPPTAEGLLLDFAGLAPNTLRRILDAVSRKSGGKPDTPTCPA
ncbi:PLP-dependent aminotransferase family protein [Kutzneria sp. 744]|uniref:aminotransferase-like domain-containing protein n=1 Tax=Kutzneria sp. (strain 744) TaxID=345341 RepID=UPI0003EEADD6|nr:PLP-dependent aminotransferase family protein [Kutzneria sp. 744]EWM10669.1 transcriptional regulator, GntR family [Kutzneria sp. 744]